MKKLFLLVLPVMLLLAACAPVLQAAAPLMQLPDEARILILVLLTSALTWLLLWLSVVLKIDLVGYAQPLAAVLAPIIITIIEHYLQLVPPELDTIVLTIIHLIVLLLGSIGTIVVFRKLKARQVKQLLA